MSRLLFNWPCQRILNSPTSLDAIPNCAALDSQLCGPAGNGQPLAAKLKIVVAARVACLLFWCGPAAISCPSLLRTLLAMTTGVAGTVIYSVNAMLRAWFRPQVCKEVHETMLPFLANRDSAAPINMIVTIVWISATFKHCFPGSVFPSVIHAMFHNCLHQLFLLEAATTQGIATSQAATAYRAMLSALTPTEPYGDLRFSANKAKHGEPTKHLAGHIFNLFIGYRHNLGQFFATAIADNCKKWELRGMLRHVISSMKATGRPGTFIASPGTFLGCYSSILAQMYRFGHVSYLFVFGSQNRAGGPEA